MELPVLLSQGGFEVDIYAEPGSWVLKNSFYKRHIPAAADPDIFVDELMAMVAAAPDAYDWIIPGDDIVIRMLNERITDEATFYRFMPLVNIDHRSILGTKSGLSQLCSRYNITTPGYAVYSDGMSIADIATAVPFPMMVKEDMSEGGYGVYICHNESELGQTINSIQNRRNLVFQQYIKGPEINTEVLFHKGQLMVYSYSERLDCFGQFGVSTSRIYYNNPAMEAELSHIGKTLGLSGFGNVVFMLNERDNKHYLIEVDMRPNSWMFYGQYTGNDFAKAIAQIAAGTLQPVRPDSTLPNKRKVIALYKKDIYRCLVHKDVKGLLKWTVNWSQRWRYIPRYDKTLLNASTDFLLTTFADMVKGKLKRA